MVFWFLGKTNDSHNLKEKQLAKESCTKDPDDNKLKGIQKKKNRFLWFPTMNLGNQAEYSDSKTEPIILEKGHD